LNHKFGRHKDETRFNAIRRLHTILNQDNRLPEVVTISEKPKTKRALNEKRSLESLEDLLLDNLQKDEHLKMIFGDKDTNHPDYFTTQIPEYFEFYDVRKPADVYVQDKLKGIVSESFEAHRRLEKGMTRRELLAFDKTLAAFLKKESLMPRLKRAVDSDFNNLHHGRSVMERAKDYKEDEWQQGLKTQNLQREYNKRIQDEDAEFKLLAYNGMLDKINREKYDKQE